MKRLIIKTVAITLSAILVLCGLIYGALALFAPKSLAGVYTDLGNNKLAVKYYEKQWNKTKSNIDLYNLCVAVDVYADNQKANEYLSAMLNVKDFENFCISQDKKDSMLTTEEFLEGKFVIALYIKTRRMDDVLNACYKSAQDGYTKYNPFYMLYSEANLKLNQSALEKTKAKIESMLGELNASERSLAEQDINTLLLMIG